MISLLVAGMLAAAVSAPAEVRVEVMRTRSELSRGLQGHRPLQQDEGMLFVLPAPEEAHFWMKAVTFPIDIVFIDAAGKVDQIAHEVPPCPETPCPVYSSHGAVTHVLEVPAGWSRKNGIKRGTPFHIDEAGKIVTVGERAKK
jgi:uncharacterized membrane protein (UPF0127 family)